MFCVLILILFKSSWLTASKSVISFSSNRNRKYQVGTINWNRRNGILRTTSSIHSQCHRSCHYTLKFHCPFFNATGLDIRFKRWDINYATRLPISAGLTTSACCDQIKFLTREPAVVANISSSSENCRTKIALTV